MRNRLDQCQTELPLSDGTFEQQRKTPDRRAGRFAKRHPQPLKRGDMVFAHLRQAQRQAPERQLVTGQDEVPVLGHFRKPCAAVQPLTDGVCLRLGRIDPKIGRDAGQKLIAADDKIILLRPERRVFRRVTVACRDKPVAPAETHCLAIDKPRVAGRDRMHRIRRS